MERINAVGKPCPIPVIEVKKAIRALSGQDGTVEIIVDNDVARQNIEKMSRGMGYTTTFEPMDDQTILVKVEVSSEVIQDSVSGESELVVAFGHKVMGGDNEELGGVLMKSFIYSLTELDTTPEHLLFFNGGAFLTQADSGVLKDLQTLSEKGTLISTCGTCLDYYDIKETIALGEITNMYGVTQVMSQAKKVITL